MTNVTNFVYDIRGASREEVQKLATAISKAMNIDFNYQVEENDMRYSCIHAYTPSFIGLQGVCFASDMLLSNWSDEMVKSGFKAMYKVDLAGVMTAKAAIDLFNL